MIATIHDAATNQTQQANVAQEVSLARVYVLRATYLLLVIGLGGMIVPEVVSHPVISRGVIPSLLGAVWVLAFVGLKVVEYTAKVHEGNTPNQNAFYLYYFILTGLHLFHVFIGIVVLVLLLTQAGKSDLSGTRMALVEGGACFWHLVDLLWIVLFPLLYLVS